MKVQTRPGSSYAVGFFSENYCEFTQVWRAASSLSQFRGQAIRYISLSEAKVTQFTSNVRREEFIESRVESFASVR